MSSLKIYKSKNKGLGGDFDTTLDNDIFYDSNFCCVYIKNEDNYNLRLLDITLNSLDSIQLGILTDQLNTPIINQLSVFEDTENILFKDSLQISELTLSSNDFITIWLKKNTQNNVISKKNININVEYINEY